MKRNFSFEAKIYKVGINPCVKVPLRITKKMSPSKGYIPVKGTINGHPFIQTLVPIRNAEYRLYVNGLMLKGSRTKNGDRATFVIKQDFAPRTVETYPFAKPLKRRLDEEDLFPKFKQLTPSRQKEVLKYLNYLKTDEALTRNIEKVINGLKKKTGNNWFVK
ncbi:MAG: DUF1905 domain-containing protein [Ignavibacteriales bacterium]|nr:DUF1905 domain-containing protein [Ignavibacteriales bacterium]